jgi:VWFA-related protein
LADRTGGLTVLNRNDLVGGLGEILNDQRGYYLIGYEPSAATFDKDSGKPRFHKVKVGVSRPGLKVRSRAGFYGISDAEVAKKAPAPVL